MMTPAHTFLCLLFCISLLSLQSLRAQSVAGRPEPTYKEDWELFTELRHDTLFSTVVDLGLKALAPVAALPHHVALRLRLKAPRATGLASDTEYAVLGRVEDRLRQIITEGGRARFAGMTNAKGMRTLHFYALQPQVDTALLGTAFILYPQYKDYALATVPDAGWSFYLNQLYPTPLEYQKLVNGRMLKSLLLNGDALMEARPIDHFISFTTSKKAESFFKQVKKEGFAQVSLTHDTAGAARPYQLRVSRTDYVSPVSIDGVVVKLWNLAAKYDGLYDGWQTVVRK